MWRRRRRHRLSTNTAPDQCPRCSAQAFRIRGTLLGYPCAPCHRNWPLTRCCLAIERRWSAPSSTTRAFQLHSNSPAAEPRHTLPVPSSTAPFGGGTHCVPKAPLGPPPIGFQVRPSVLPPARFTHLRLMVRIPRQRAPSRPPVRCTLSLTSVEKPSLPSVAWTKGGGVLLL